MLQQAPHQEQGNAGVEDLGSVVTALSACRENLITPVGLEKSSPNSKTYALIAISNLSDLPKIDKDIKSAIVKADFDCSFIEKILQNIICNRKDRGKSQEIGVLAVQEMR